MPKQNKYCIAITEEAGEDGLICFSHRAERARKEQPGATAAARV